MKTKWFFITLGLTIMAISYGAMFSTNHIPTLVIALSAEFAGLVIVIGGATR